MAYPKKLNARNVDTKQKAVEAHAGFVSYVCGKVKTVGIGIVLQQYQPAMGAPTEFYWLKKAFDRVLTFAEQVQIKQIPTELKGNEESPVRVIFRAASDNSKP